VFGFIRLVAPTLQSATHLGCTRVPLPCLDEFDSAILALRDIQLVVVVESPTPDFSMFVESTSVLHSRAYGNDVEIEFSRDITLLALV